MGTEKVTMIRYRGSKLSKIKKMDIFTKIEEPFKETSTIGGTFSLVSFALTLWLIYWEIDYYSNGQLMFRFSPDTDFDAKLKINIDLTVAMPCAFIGADILDSTNQNAFNFGSLTEDDTWFELSPNQRLQFENRQHLNSYLREQYHAINDIMWKRSLTSLYNAFPSRDSDPDKPYDACRIHGSLILNKVSGNFHITAGKSLHLPRGHIHISAFLNDRDYNFSHRISQFSFGELSAGIVQPLEADEIIIDNSMTLVNYFIDVVPTNVKLFLKTLNTYQYSVKALKRPIDHSKGSHGMPGIYFKYDMSALKVTVSQERDNLGMFLARLCSIIGGIYVSSGILNSAVQFVYNFICCKRLQSTRNESTQRIEKIEEVSSITQIT